MSDIIDRLVPIPEAAYALGVADRTLRWWIQIGRIGSAKPGGERGNCAARTFVPASEINRVIRESRVPARPEFLKEEAQKQVETLASAA